MEIWKDIPIDELDNYQVSNLGQIRNKTTFKLLKLCIKSTNHIFVRITFKDKSKKNYQIHRLVLLSFVPIENSKNLLVNHINNNPSDNRLENLEWVTFSQNSNRTYKNKSRNRKVENLFYSQKWESAEEFYRKIMKIIY